MMIRLIRPYSNSFDCFNFTDFLLGSRPFRALAAGGSFFDLPICYPDVLFAILIHLDSLVPDRKVYQLINLPSSSLFFM